MSATPLDGITVESTGFDCATDSNHPPKVRPCGCTKLILIIESVIKYYEGTNIDKGQSSRADILLFFFFFTDSGPSEHKPRWKPVHNRTFFSNCKVPSYAG